MAANVDEATVDSLKGTYDVVFCLALVSHLKKPDRLYTLLGEMANKVLFSEGNGNTSIEDAKAKLMTSGFSEVVYIGLCDDDCLPENNKRPVFIAKK